MNLERWKLISLTSSGANRFGSLSKKAGSAFGSSTRTTAGNDAVSVSVSSNPDMANRYRPSVDVPVLLQMIPFQ